MQIDYISLSFCQNRLKSEISVIEEKLMNIVKVLFMMVMFSTAACVERTESPDPVTSIFVDIGPCIEISDTLARNECTLERVEDACFDAMWKACNGDPECAVTRILRCPLPRVEEPCDKRPEGKKCIPPITGTHG